MTAVCIKIKKMAFSHIFHSYQDKNVENRNIDRIEHVRCHFLWFLTRAIDCSYYFNARTPRNIAFWQHPFLPFHVEIKIVNNPNLVNQFLCGVAFPMFFNPRKSIVAVYFKMKSSWEWLNGSIIWLLSFQTKLFYIWENFQVNFNIIPIIRVLVTEVRRRKIARQSFT